MLARIKSNGKMIAVLPYSQMPDCNDAYIEAMGSRIFYASDLDFLPETRKETKESANAFAFDTANSTEPAHSETAVLEGWVCRENRSNLYVLPGSKPKRTGFGFWENESADCITLPMNSFPSVTWQTEPKKVRIELTLIDE